MCLRVSKQVFGGPCEAQPGAKQSYKFLATIARRLQNEIGVEARMQPDVSLGMTSCSIVFKCKKRFVLLVGKNFLKNV